MSAGSATGPRWRPGRGWSRSISSTPRAACWWRPIGGVERRFSTAPYCVGVPRPGQDPLVLDFATSIVAEGKVLVASQGGKKMPGRRADRARRQARAAIRTCSTATTRRPARATTARAPAPSAPSATTRAPGSPSCARSWAGRCRAPARPIPSAAASPTACCRSTSIPRCSIRRASSRTDVAKYVDFVKSSRPAQAGGEVLVPGEPEARMRARAAGRRRAAARRHLGRDRRDGPLGRA